MYVRCQKKKGTRRNWQREGYTKIEKVEQFTKLTDTRKICEWVMKCSDYGQYKTVYTWIAPNRTSKVPLKVIIRMAIKMDIPIEEFLKK